MFIKSAVALQSFLFSVKCRLEEEEGQTFVEWLGVLAIIVLVVGAVAGLAPALGKSIGTVATKAVNAIGSKIS